MSLYCQDNPAVYTSDLHPKRLPAAKELSECFSLTHAPYSNYNSLQVTYTKQSGPDNIPHQLHFLQGIGHP